MKRYLFLISAVCLAILSFAEEPQLKDARLVARSAAAGLGPEVAAITKAEAGAAWIGYAVPAIPGEHHMCCFNFNELQRNPQCCGGCRLEGHNGGSFIGKMSDCKQLEPAKEFYVLFRLQDHKVVKVRPYSADCALDVGGLTLYWLSAVRPAESIALLERMIDGKTLFQEDATEEAISALAMHADPAADAALDRLVSPVKSDSLREHAAFWLGSTRGHHGFEILRNLLRNPGEQRTLEEFVFALSQDDDPGAQPELIRLARSDARAEVREQALFWLAQRAGEKVATTITDAIEQDPDTDVKKKAVFSLTQMPNDEGVPLLIQVASNNRNPVVRKEAIFWLGQSGDSRALDYIESILEK